ncbi:hypothetical protein, partial [Citrobacter freundii]|uniref:hypothetical protein n=1 Tax=Citrobacter freundii TaxID=546 RepID=UPI0028F80E35
WKPPAHSPEENMVRQKCSGIRRSYLGDAVKGGSVDALRTITSSVITVGAAFTAQRFGLPITFP